MATGKILEWRETYGFIRDDDNGTRVFFHINNSRALKGRERDIAPGATVVFDTRPSQSHTGSC